MTVPDKDELAAWADVRHFVLGRLVDGVEDGGHHEREAPSVDDR